ncbi:MAG: DNA-directed RNA polymerase subunit alpha C-terminal domain-containing protein [Pseudomonadota bacterium]
MSTLSTLTLIAIWLTCASTWAVILINDWRIKAVKKHFLNIVELHAKEIALLMNQVEHLKSPYINPFTKQDIERFTVATESPKEMLLSEKIDSITSIGTGAKNCLHDAGIYTIRALTRKTRADLLGIYGLGHKTFKEIDDFMSMAGLTLTEETK